MTELLQGLECLVSVDHVICPRYNEFGHLEALDLVLERLEDIGLSVAAHLVYIFGHVYLMAWQSILKW